VRDAWPYDGESRVVGWMQVEAKEQQNVANAMLHVLEAVDYPLCFLVTHPDSPHHFQGIRVSRFGESKLTNTGI
jgi:hypothetical protein